MAPSPQLPWHDEVFYENVPRGLATGMTDPYKEMSTANAPMAEIACDYLVVGGGAAAMAFVDTLLCVRHDVSCVVVDRRAAPGGHWLD